MPRRPRLSVPTIFLNAPEGFAMWDMDGRLVDRNDALDRLFSDESPSAAEVSDTLGNFLFEPAESMNFPGIVPPERTFQGHSVSLIVSHPNDAARLFRLEAWPCRNEQNVVIGVLGRFEPVGEADLERIADPARIWGTRLQEELIRRRALQKQSGLDSIIGHGPSHDALLNRVQAAIRADCPVVIVGEAATGRHHLARVIHLNLQKSHGARLPLIPLDAASLPSEILARDFLGIDPASDAPARSDSKAVWRVPPGATILVESLAALDPRLQDGIARAQGQVRLLSLAHSREEIERLEPRLRARAATFVIELEPMRRRIDEIPMLAQMLIDRFQSGSKVRIEGFTAEALERLKMYDWPGNWRELERVLRRIFETSAGPLVEASDIPAEIQGAFGGAWTKPTRSDSTEHLLESALQQASRATVLEALNRFGSNKAAVARALGVSRPKLYRLMAELGLDE